MRVAVLVFLFLARIRFPRNESIASIVRKRYSGEILKTIRKFEKVDYKFRKAKLDINFLIKCQRENVIPNFLKFRLANKDLRNSVTYIKCQQNLLQTEINNKKSRLRTLQNEFNRLHNDLQFSLDCIDFAHISAIILSSNDNPLKTHDSIQQKKFNKLLTECKPKQDAEKIIFNFSNVSITEAEKSLLVKGLSFSLPPKKLSYSDYLVNFELFYRSIDNLNILTGDNLGYVKTKIKDLALISLRNYNANIPQHLSNEESEALKNLPANCNLIIQKADKGNSVVLVEKDVYLVYRHIEKILDDATKCEKVKIKKGILNFSINHERRINDYLKSLEKSGSLTTDQCKKIKAIGSRPGILYGLCKVHKAIIDVCPSFRPILSVIGTPSYKLAKFLVPKLSSITFNELTVKDSFAFAEEIVHQYGTLFMGSLDVDSLFTNIPLKEAINICTNLLYKNVDVIEGINKSEFENLLSLATQESYFMFNDILYTQKDGVAMGSPLGRTMAKVFLSFYEMKWLEQCPNEFKPVFYRRYVDDIFVLFQSAEHLSKFHTYLNTCHPNMSCSFEQEINDKLSFLDVEVSRQQGKFVTTVYRKPTFSGVYTHFDSFLPEVYKVGMIYTIAYRCFKVCSNWTKFHEELNFFIHVFLKNGYPLSFIDKCFKMVINKLVIKRPQVTTVEKKTLILSLPYLGDISLQTRTKLRTSFKSILNCCKLQIVFKSQRKLANVF